MVLVLPIGELILFHPEIKAIANIKKGTQGRNLNSTSGLLNEITLLRLLAQESWEVLLVAV